MIIQNKGVLANIHYSFIRWKNQFTFEISGSNGFITVESLPKWGEGQIVTYGERILPSGTPRLSTWEFDTDNSWVNEWDYFLKCIKEQNSSYNVEEGFLSMKLADDIRVYSEQENSIH